MGRPQEKFDDLMLAEVDRTEEILEHCKSANDTNLNAFTSRFFRRAAQDDFAVYSSAELASIAQSLWDFVEKREPDQRKIRIFNPDKKNHGWISPNTIVEAVGEDVPFLVDSLLAAISHEELEIRAVVHPIVPIIRQEDGQRTGIGVPGRDEGAIRESVIHVQIEPISNTTRLFQLTTRLEKVFGEVATAVGDWRQMIDRLDQTVAELAENRPPIDPQDLNEAMAFLNWLRDNHFTFLGSRDYEFADDGQTRRLAAIPNTGLGLLRDPDAKVLRREGADTGLSPEVADFLMQPSPLIITKSNTRSTVHRRVHMDYVGVKRFADDGTVVGERRFVGLFTAGAYNGNVLDIPLLRRKVEVVLLRAGFSPAGHDGKALLNILETFPRDELFQITDDELYTQSIGMMQLEERPRTRVFARWDKFDRFVSAIVFVPRDRYTTELREKVGEILRKGFGGRISAYYPRFGDEPLARVHFIVGRKGNSNDSPDIAQIEAQIAEATRTWNDHLLVALQREWGENAGTQKLQAYGNAFSEAFKEKFDAATTVADIKIIEKLGLDGNIDLMLYRREGDADDVVRLKLYRRGDTIVLSDCLPILENMGLRIKEEQAYDVKLGSSDTVSIHDFLMSLRSGKVRNFAKVRKNFEDAFASIWSGKSENDGFNELVLAEGLLWRDVTIIRAIAKYLRQVQIPYSQNYMEDALVGNSQIARLLVALFNARLAPDVGGNDKDRQSACANVRSAIATELEFVQSLDEDRILNRYCNFIESVLRTNFFQTDVHGNSKDYVSFKLDSQSLVDLPEPKPHVEIFVYAAFMEGIHFRFGKVARGGLRWSDRREDFRTEILGLVKAQRVKNAVIVPVGAKGGFVPKNLPANGSREEIQEEAIRCYKMFISGLLDITDNLVGGEVAQPENVVRHDGDDPYLVVAADKGTAAFSDIANGVAKSYGFWLGDAFASGGSNGYDHKKMGITARGAWEAVKRHFREIGKDIQKTPFTVVGVGDMSGDVFGNGMLLSEQTQLVAAFDHRDIFVDPTPDKATSYEERSRLFEMGQSSWADYDQSKISKGGGIFSRQSKSIPISTEVKALTGLKKPKVTPNELIQALLKTKVDLLWFGGIGTFVKAKNESHDAAGDRANDSVRINAYEVGANVVGEGANLGMTQRARIEFARNQGRINTDAVDNSSGVDCSDHEVNIKILLDAAVERGELSTSERNALLSEMDAQVANLVLRNNYQQSLAITISQETAAKDVEAQSRFICELERAGRMDREIEMLPDDEAMRDLSLSGQGLTRPEISVLIAYAKLTLFDALLDSDVPDDPQFTQDLSVYFPDALQKKYAAGIQKHRLRREIIANELANIVVNSAGSTFVNRIRDEIGVPAEDVVRAYMIVRNSYETGKIYDQINTLDNRVPASVQTEMHLACKSHTRRQSLWFLQQLPQPLKIEETVSTFAPGVQQLRSNIETFLSPFQKQQLEARKKAYLDAGVPKALAYQVASLPSLSSGTEIVLIAQKTGRTLEDAAQTYYAFEQQFGFDRLKSVAEAIDVNDHWERLALTRSLGDIANQHRLISIEALGLEGATSGQAAVEGWLDMKGSNANRLLQMTSELDASAALTMARVVVTASQLRHLTGLC